MEDQPSPVVPRCPSSPHPGHGHPFSVHVTPSSNRTQCRMSPRTTPYVLNKTHLLGAGCWPTTLTYPAVNLAARKSRPGSPHTHTHTLEVISVRLEGDPMLGFKIPAPRKIQRHNKHHTQRTALVYTTITSPGLTNASSQLKAQANVSMILKIH